MLLNKKAVRGYILAAWLCKRATYEITRVDPAVYVALENMVKEKINAVIERHMSRGKTFFID